MLLIIDVVHDDALDESGSACVVGVKLYRNINMVQKEGDKCEGNRKQKQEIKGGSVDL